MKVKVSEYTPYLLIGLIVVIIIRHFYDPSPIPDIWTSQTGEIPYPEPVMQAIITIFFPYFVSMAEIMVYPFKAMTVSINSQAVVLFTTELICFGYLLITFCLERFHAYWHEEESVFALCIDMLCVENLVMYIFDLVSYIINEIFSFLDIPNEIYIILSVLVALPVMWGMLFQMVYSMVGMLLNLGVPILIAVLLSNKMDETIALYIGIIISIFFSQVIWRLCSEFIYDILLYAFTFRHLRLLD